MNHEVENPTIGSDKASLHDWIIVELSHTLLEELANIVGRITDRMIFMLKEQIMTIRTVNEVVRTTQDG